MKTIKINVAVVAMILGAFTAFAFKPAAVNPKLANRNWYYTGNTTQSQFVIAGNYSTTNPGSSCQATAARPCKLFVNADNTTQLQSILTPLTPDDVMDIADGQKN